MITPYLRQIPSPQEDPVEYSKVWLIRELSELGDRVSVREADLTDEVTREINASGITYGNAIMAIDEAKRMVAATGDSIVSALKVTLVRKGANQALDTSGL